jgi:hypothetical protein
MIRFKKILVVSVMVVACACGFYRLNAEEYLYESYPSPDGRYKVEVVIVGHGILELPRFPGSSGDRPGYIRLIDSRGHVLEKENVEMVNGVDPPRWRESSVDVKFFAEWSLPD